MSYTENFEQREAANYTAFLAWCKATGRDDDDTAYNGELDYAEMLREAGGAS